MTRLALAGLALAACSIPASDFHATVTDDSGTGNLQPVAPIMILSSVDRLAIDEGDGGTILVHLSSPPDGNLAVLVALDAGPVTASPAMLVFDAASFSHDQTIMLSSALDSNTVSEQQALTLRADGVDAHAITIESVDKDRQNIKVTPASVAVKEQTTTATLQVSLTQQPSTSVKLTLTSSTGKAHVDRGELTFTPQNYAEPQPVVVDGASDADVQDDSDTVVLSATDPDNATPLSRSVPVAIADDDRIQAIQVTATTLAVAEGGAGSFDVSLRYDPGASVTVALADSNPGALPIDKTSIGFNSATFATPVRVTVRPPVDANTVSETATVTLTGGGAPSPTTVALTATDKTVVDAFGWPTPFTATASNDAGFAYAYQIHLTSPDTLDAFHTWIPVAAGQYRMALYSDAGGQPGFLVAESGAGRTVVNGTNDAPAATATALSSPTYFLAIRASTAINVGYQQGAAGGPFCINFTPYGSLAEPWQSTFVTPTCGIDAPINIWITAHHQ